MNNSPNPSCTQECRIVNSAAQVTCAYYPLTYDKNGNLIHTQGGNIASYQSNCLTCNKSWLAKTQNGNTTYTEITKPKTINKITKKFYHDQCFDGCCDSYGTDWRLNGELIYSGPDDELAWIKILEKLGIDVDVEDDI
jgi:hypothetical protein